jgi:exodeoxyribonuclease VIII
MDHPETPTPAMILGAAAHCLILEPDRFAEQFAVAGRCCAVKKTGERCENPGKACAGDEWFCGVHAKGIGGGGDGRTILSPDDAEAVRGMAAAVNAHPAARALLDRVAQVELSAFWTDQASGVFCKGRIDLLTKDNVIGDLKTTEDDASPEGFARSVCKYKYHVQAIHYLRGLLASMATACDDYQIIAVEKSAPYAVAVYRINEEQLMLGKNQIDEMLTRWAECEKSATWPAYADGVVELSLPAWAVRTL